jgi:hypothetical protein
MSLTDFYAAIRKAASRSPLAEGEDISVDSTPGTLSIYTGRMKVAEGTGKDPYEAGIDAIINLYVDNQR